MAKAFDISLLGDKALERKFRKLPLAAQKKVLRPALRAGAKLMLTSAKGKVTIKTGALQRSLKLRAMKAVKGGWRVGFNVFPERSMLNIDPKDKYYYPAAVEYGHKGAAAKPFLRPAFEENKQKALLTVAQKMRTQLPIVMSKL